LNFTLHYRLALRDLERPLAAVGAMLPDLWRMVDRRVRPAREPCACDDRRATDVLAGVAHHFGADAAFHASDAFRAGERALAADLARVPSSRLPLFAHVTWEMCLDGALVRREGAVLLAALGRDVSAALEPSPDDESPVSAAARVHHAARKGEPLPSGFAARVESLLGDLRGGGWVAGYADGATVAERLDGIRQRLGFEPLDEEDKAGVAVACTAAIARGEAALGDVLALRI
jgi:hypothetical protein